jgi:hypothetical protein
MPSDCDRATHRPPAPQTHIMQWCPQTHSPGVATCGGGKPSQVVFVGGPGFWTQSAPLRPMTCHCGGRIVLGRFGASFVLARLMARLSVSFHSPGASNALSRAPMGRPERIQNAQTEPNADSAHADLLGMLDARLPRDSVQPGARPETPPNLPESTPNCAIQPAWHAGCDWRTGVATPLGPARSANP